MPPANTDAFLAMIAGLILARTTDADWFRRPIDICQQRLRVHAAGVAPKPSRASKLADFTPAQTDACVDHQP